VLQILGGAILVLFAKSSLAGWLKSMKTMARRWTTTYVNPQSEEFHWHWPKRSCVAILQEFIVSK
jgi:hypothetical protein